MPFKLRDYRAADFDRLWEIDQFCFAEGISYTQMELSGFITRRNAITVVADFDGLPPKQERSTEPITHFGNGTNAGESQVGLTATAEQTAGFIIAHPVRGKSGRILTLDIVPEARQRGLASLLMNECERRLRGFGCTEVYLETAVNNAPALGLYRKLGYEILRTLPDYYAGPLDGFLMGKAL